MQDIKISLETVTPLFLRGAEKQQVLFSCPLLSTENGDVTQFTLTMLDTSDIQNYIFNSNRLQENISAPRGLVTQKGCLHER